MQKTAYEMRISDWSSDVCSSDLLALAFGGFLDATLVLFGQALLLGQVAQPRFLELAQDLGALVVTRSRGLFGRGVGVGLARLDQGDLLAHRSEEHTSELQSLMRISYAVFCLKKKTKSINHK